MAMAMFRVATLYFRTFVALILVVLVYNVQQILDLTRKLEGNRIIFHIGNQPYTRATSGTNDGVVSSMISSKRLPQRVLIIAAVPKDARHAATLWTELECFTMNVDKVIVSAPGRSHEIVEEILKLARQMIPHFVDGEVELQARYYKNDRYDVGLWCDALQAMPKDDVDEFGLLNDSVFAMRPDSTVFDNLQAKNQSLTSLGYSYSAKFFREYGPEHYWVESIFRGMNEEGLQTFMNHSCVPASHPFFCSKDPSDARRKACIVNNFEHDLASQYPRHKVGGMFLADAPTELITKHSGKTWSTNVAYWKKVVEEQGFPLVKSKRTNIIPDDADTRTLLNHPLLQNCTRHSTDELHSLLRSHFGY